MLDALVIEGKVSLSNFFGSVTGATLGPSDVLLVCACLGDDFAVFSLGKLGGGGDSV